MNGAYDPAQSANCPIARYRHPDRLRLFCRGRGDPVSGVRGQDCSVLGNAGYCAARLFLSGPCGDRAGWVASLAWAPSQRTVVWLDELQRYLDGENGVTGGLVRALLNLSHAAVIIGTMWPDRYTRYRAVPSPGDADSHAREREVLDLADVVSH